MADAVWGPAKSIESLDLCAIAQNHGQNADRMKRGQKANLDFGKRTFPGMRESV
jgi:hypothetical protein